MLETWLVGIFQSHAIYFL